MAILRRVGDTADVPLPAQCLVGRSAACTVRIEGTYVSGEHAKLLWTGGQWRVKDLGSKNGTFVDGARLKVGTSAVVRAGSKIGFGEEDNLFELVDDGPPNAMAVDVDSGDLVRAGGELLTLPSADEPSVSVYPDNNGGGWVMEDAEGEPSPVKEGDVVEVGGRHFRLHLPVTMEATPLIESSLPLDAVSLSLAVSADEERVEITIRRGAQEKKLESREHSYLLLVLARARQEDEGLPPGQRGWREVRRLNEMLKTDANWVYVATHRARQQFANAGIHGAAGIVEVRRGSRRLGVERFEIVSLDE